MSAYRMYAHPFACLALAVGALAALFFSSGGQAAEVGCTRICAQIVQAIGDEIKEQIPLDCIQETGACTGVGYFQTADARVPVTIEGQLSGETLTLKVASGQSMFAPAEGDALVMPLTPGNPYQATQFVVGQKTAETPFARAGTSLTVTVIAERQI
jgi:hypothetical protein